MSRIADMLQAKNVLPPLRRKIFESLYLRGLPQQQALQELGLTSDEFEREHSAMLRSLRGSTLPGGGAAGSLAAA